MVAAGTPASAASRTYRYSIEHADYGTIGSYTDTVEDSGGERRIDTKLRVAVKLLGVTVYREEADRTEVWRGDRLISFNGLTVTDGKPIEVHGEASANGFVITTPSGTVTAPANVYPSSPWSVDRPPGSDVMMSTKNGKVEAVRIIDDGVGRSSVRGVEMQVRHFEILSDKRQEVWADAAGVPVRFRTQENGAAVDFVLQPENLASLSDSLQ